MRTTAHRLSAPGTTEATAAKVQQSSASACNYHTREKLVPRGKLDNWRPVWPEFGDVGEVEEGHESWMKCQCEGCTLNSHECNLKPSGNSGALTSYLVQFS